MTALELTRKVTHCLAS